MSWNNGLERKKFEARMAKQAKEYRAAGMTEEQIKAMYEFDLEQFNSDRRYYTHTQPLDIHEEDDDGEEVENSFVRQFIDAFSVTDEDGYFYNTDRYGWIDCIENPTLFNFIKGLSSTDIDIITLHVYENHDLKETAAIIGLPHVNAWRRFERIKKKISEIFS